MMKRQGDLLVSSRRPIPVHPANRGSFRDIFKISFRPVPKVYLNCLTFVR